MIHHTCDSCKKMIAANDPRFVVKMDVFMAEDQNRSTETVEDNLTELDYTLKELEDLSSEATEQECSQQLRFDLCSACRKKFLQNPMGQPSAAHAFNFSEN